jgi:hypothetical protein
MKKTLWAAALLSLGTWSATAMAQQSGTDNPCSPGEMRNASGACVSAGQNTLGQGITGGGGSGSGGGTGEDTVGGAAATGTGTGAASGSTGSGSGTTMMPSGSGDSGLSTGVTGGGGSGSGGGTGEDTVGGSRSN